MEFNDGFDSICSPVGFIGFGRHTIRIIENLLSAGCRVQIWGGNRKEVRGIIRRGAIRRNSASEVIASCKVIFSTFSSSHKLKETFYIENGILPAVTYGTCIVDMSSTDPDTSRTLSNDIMEKGGNYLEARIVNNSSSLNKDGNFVLLTAGSKSLFDAHRTCFAYMGRHVFYLGDTGNASMMNLISEMIQGTMQTSLAESMMLASRIGLHLPTVQEVLELGRLKCPAIRDLGNAIIEKSYENHGCQVNMPLEAVQRDLQLAIMMGDKVNQSMPTTAAANEVLKRAESLEKGKLDISAVAEVFS